MSDAGKLEPRGGPAGGGPAAGEPAGGEPADGGPAGGEPAGGHPTNGLSETVHQRHRLGILTIAAEARRAEFGYFQQALNLTAGNLSRHLGVLEEAGLIETEKGYAGRRPRTWVAITRRGRAALAAEIRALTDLVSRYAQPDDQGSGHE